MRLSPQDKSTLKIVLVLFAVSAFFWVVVVSAGWLVRAIDDGPAASPSQWRN